MFSISVLRRRTSANACVALLVAASAAQAQTKPDAGTVRQQIERQQRTPLPSEGRTLFAPPPPLKSIGGTKITVRRFPFSGNTLLSNVDLQPVVLPFLDRPLDFNELQNAAIAVATAYRKAGWVVRVYLPQQDVTGGSVTIQIIEANLGKTVIEGQSKRISAARVQKMVEAAQNLGKPISADALDRALLLIGDMPGVSANGRLAEGSNPGDSDLIVALSDTHLITGDVTVDNAGARFTGAGRAIVDASLNSALGIGDRADATVLHTKGSDYQRLAYSLPVGNDGWRVGVNGTHLSYRIVTSEFEALDARGTSTSFGLDATYPIIRSRLLNFYFTAGAEDQRFNNQSAGETSSRYTIQDGTLGLYGNLFDTLGGGGANTASVTVMEGHVDLNDSPNEIADALTTDTGGSFQKLNLSLSRTQTVTERFSLYGSVSGQLASRNLDSSQKLYLGGSAGVRGYPADEAGGAEGILFNFEARERLPFGFNVAGFFDWGSVHVNKDNGFPGAASPNSIDLKGAGLSVGWASTFGLTLKATVAHRIGTNPNPTINGDDQDGTHVDNRIWVQATLPF
ncbi:MAG TPA: ShlB/FhaC/HecB family hemolysin secretion/activation protein [Steroidobacteraceae bacterium]